MNKYLLVTNECGIEGVVKDIFIANDDNEAIKIAYCIRAYGSLDDYICEEGLDTFNKLNVDECIDYFESSEDVVEFILNMNSEEFIYEWEGW